MTVRNIITYPAEILRRPAAPVENFDAELQRLVDDMFATMYAAAGVGLAAPQIGISQRLFVIDPGPASGQERLAVVNPEIIARSGEVLSDEGCLSIPGYTAEVPRAESVVMRAQDLSGTPFELELHGFPAIVVQHESDHLDGVLFVDYLSPTRWRLFERDFGRDPFRWRYAARR